MMTSSAGLSDGFTMIDPIKALRGGRCALFIVLLLRRGATVRVRDVLVRVA